MSKELEVKVTQAPAKIDFNYEEMKQVLAEKMEVYNATVVTEDTVGDAKKDLASLRKVKKALNDRRIEVKKEYDRPYDEFKKKVDELAGLIDKPIEKIDEQVKDFVEREKEEKRAEITELYNNLIGELEEYLPLNKIYNDRWENKSYAIKDIEEEIKQVVESTSLAIVAIKGMKSDAEEKALELFKADLSLTNAIAHINQHEQLKAQIKAEEEAKRKAEEEAKKQREKELELERVREEERKRLAEIEKAKEEERIKYEEEKAKEEALKETSKEDEHEPIDLPFLPDIEDIPDELPVIEEGAKFIIYGEEKDFEKVEKYIQFLELDYKRE